MSKNIRTGVSTRAVQKLQNLLTLGMYQAEHYRKEYTESKTLCTTHYLLKDGSIVTYREWHQLNRPEYIVSGTKHGCLGHRARHESSFLSSK